MLQRSIGLTRCGAAAYNRGAFTATACIRWADRKDLVAMDELYDAPGHLIRRAQQIAVSIFLDECLPVDLTPVQFAALVAVREHPGIDATRLSALVAFDRSTLGNVLERLETKGLIVRSGSAGDKRVKALHLSANGEAALKQAEPLARRAQERILAPLAPDDRETFMRMLSQMVELNNDASRAPLRPVAQPPEAA